MNHGTSSAPYIFFSSVCNLDSRPSPSPSPASRLLFAPPAQAYTRSLPRVQKGPSAQPCIAHSRPRAHPLPYPAPPPGGHRPCVPLLASSSPGAPPPPMVQPRTDRCRRSRAEAIVVSCFRNPRRPPAWHALPPRAAVVPCPCPCPCRHGLARPTKYVAATAVHLPSPCCPTYLTNIDPPIRSLTGTQEGSSLVAVIGSA